MTAKVVSAKRTELKSRGHGNTPNRASCLSEKQETRLWETGALGDSNPEALVHAVWYCTTKGFGFRGCNEARQLKWGDITKKTTDDGETYLEWNERLTKTRAGNSSHQRPFAPIFSRRQSQSSTWQQCLVCRHAHGHEPTGANYVPCSEKCWADWWEIQQS